MRKQNNHETTIYFTALICCCLLSIADNPGGRSTTVDGKPIIFPPGNPTPVTPPTPGKPKKPALSSVEGYYENGIITVSFASSEGMSELSVYSVDQSELLNQQTFYSDSEVSLYVGELNEAYILIETSAGNQYEGWLY